MVYKILITVFLIGGALGYSIYSKKSLEAQLGQESEHLLKTLPVAEFKTLDQQDYFISDLLNNAPKGIFVHFWATWCGPCEAELPELLEFIDNSAEGITFLIIAVNDELPKIRKFMGTLKMRPSERKVVWLLDNNSIHREKFGSMKLPETFLFKGNGEILRRFVGPQEWLKPQYSNMFAPLNSGH